MNDIAIKAEDVGKLYRIGQIGTGTISHDLNRWWARMRGKEDPFAKIGETNNRPVKNGSEYLWSLKGVDFEIKKGETVGIIGRNGAGKSTLLKLLSKVTKPTTGSIRLNGRIASLLEVGTGFHPEMTGRENTYLNGAILGMTKKEITKKFDEIVAFSGVERYIDTPVKRYSSGMYVRLAFAVAAHLESEILIVDEVLAVGDAEFQRKCLGKMNDVSKGEGRTVLFVSHNMNSIKSLCNYGYLLANGRLISSGEINKVTETYLNANNYFQRFYDVVSVNSTVKTIGINSDNIFSGLPLIFTITLKEVMKNVEFEIGIYSFSGEKILNLSTKYYKFRKESNIYECIIQRNPLAEGNYYINVLLEQGNYKEHFQQCVSFTVLTGDYYKLGWPAKKEPSIVYVEHEWR